MVKHGIQYLKYHGILMDLDYSDYSDLNYTQLAFPGFHQQLQN
jgi:hypothetical protein